MFEGEIELADPGEQFRVPVVGQCVLRFEAQRCLEDPFRTTVIVVRQEDLIGQQVQAIDIARLERSALRHIFPGAGVSDRLFHAQVAL